MNNNLNCAIRLHIHMYISMQCFDLQWARSYSYKNIFLIYNCLHYIGTHFYKFPRELMSEWCENLQISEDSMNTRTRVCNLHFAKEWLFRKKLKRDAIPTLNLGKLQRCVHLIRTDYWSSSCCKLLITGHNGLPKHIPIEKRIKRTCCVRNCYTASADTVLYGFPPGNERTVWLNLLKLNDNNKRLWICGLHFRPSFMKRKHLVQGAYPEFHLGNENIEPLQEFTFGNENNEPLQESADPLAEVTAEEQLVEINCSKCKLREARCSELQKEIDGVRLKINELTQKRNLHRQKKSKRIDNNKGNEEHEVVKEEEFIWLILN